MKNTLILPEHSQSDEELKAFEIAKSDIEKELELIEEEFDFNYEKIYY